MDVELNEKLDRDYGDLEPSHEHHMHGEWCKNASEGAPPFISPPI